MKHVGVYRTAFPSVSEPFIKEQALHLATYQPTFIMRSKLRDIEFQNVSLSERDLVKVKQILFTLTRAPLLFGNTNVLTNLNLIHAHFAPDGVYALPLAEKLGIPLIVTTHGYHTDLYRRSIQRPWAWDSKNRLRYQSLQLLLHEGELKAKASAFIAVSRFIEEKLVQGGYPKEKVILLYLGVDTEKFSPASKNSDERYILCVGRLSPKKGIDTLLRAFAHVARKHPSVYLIQVGAGNLAENSSLDALAEKLSIKEFHINSSLVLDVFT